MLSYTYPFIKFVFPNSWIGCKPALIFYLIYFFVSQICTCKKRKMEIDIRKISIDKICKNFRICFFYIFIYMLALPLYLFLPSTGQPSTLITEWAEKYLQYESVLSCSICVILIYNIAHKCTWQHIRILDRISAASILSTILATILTRQVDSYWLANLIWLALLEAMCICLWCHWKDYKPFTNSNVDSTNSFQPAKTYKQLFPQQQRLADKLADTIRNHDADEPLSICIAGKWGAGKTSLVNGTIDLLREDTSMCQYECIYVNTMELDTVSSLFTYVFGRIRAILKKHGAYVGIGSEYRQFITSAIGKITDSSLATLLESNLISSSEDYRIQIKELEECVAAVLDADRILIIVDDVERCDTEKAQQFIFFIKEIATMRNCITVFLADYEYLDQRLSATSGNTDELKEKSYSFYEKFFNFRIDIPPVDFQIVIPYLELELRKNARELGFRSLSELYGVFEEKLQQIKSNYIMDAKLPQNSARKEEFISRAEEMNRLCSVFRSSISSPRMLIKYCNVANRECSNLHSKYVKNDILKEDTSIFFSLIHFDEIFFLLIFIEVCTPYEALCLKEQGIAYLQSVADGHGNTRKLIHNMGEGLLYSNRSNHLVIDDKYRYDEAVRFTQAYLDGDLPDEVKGFSSRDQMWLNAIENNNQNLMEIHWAEMVEMVVRNFSWKDSEKGLHYLGILFSFAKDEFFTSNEGIEKVFSIFDKEKHHEDIFFSSIPVAKIFVETFGDTLTKCSQNCFQLLNQFKSVYFWKRTPPICNAFSFMAPVECSKTDELSRKISDANEIMLSDEDPINNLTVLLNKLCRAVPSVKIPSDGDIFQRLRFLADEEAKYMTESGLIQYDDIKERVNLLKIAIEDMEGFAVLMQKVKENTILIGDTKLFDDLADMDEVIQRFENVLKAPNAGGDISLRRSLQQLFDKIRFGDVELSDRQYNRLQHLITESEKFIGYAPYNRKILLDHWQVKAEDNTISTAVEDKNSNQDS